MSVPCGKPGCGRKWPRDPVLEVACPTCHAAIGARCRRPSEHRVFGGEPHPERDRAADRAGHYGKCPLGLCGLDRVAKGAGDAKVARGLAGPRAVPPPATLRRATPMATFQHSMTAAEYLAALERLGFAQTGLESDAGISTAGRFFGVAPRTGRAWAVDGPPNPVAVCLRLMLANKIEAAAGERMLELAAAYPLGPKPRRKR